MFIVFVPYPDGTVGLFLVGRMGSYSTSNRLSTVTAGSVLPHTARIRNPDRERGALLAFLAPVRKIDFNIVPTVFLPLSCLVL